MIVKNRKMLFYINITYMSPLYYTFIIFIAIMIIIYYTKPLIMFDKDKIKQFGIGENKTLTPLPVISIIIAILLYVIFFYIDSINKITTPLNQSINQSILPINNNVNSYTYKLVRTAPDGSLIFC